MTKPDKQPTEQETFWSSDFGDDYIDRNQGEKLLASNLNFFNNALASCEAPSSCVEFGANIGMNLRALGLMFPDMDRKGIEINATAAAELITLIGDQSVFKGSISDFKLDWRADLVLIKGVLIHLNPDQLGDVYEKLYTVSNRYILVAEYYNPSPVSIDYRGHSDKLFKRDFAGEILDTFSDLRLIDYGFAYHRDVKYAQDDITWFLLEKK